MALIKKALAACCVIGLAGCATAAVPAAEYAKPRETIRAAEEQAAAEDPQARYYLDLAKERVERADRLLEKGEGDAARLTLLKAQADAELALSLAQREQTRREVRQTERRLQELRQQIDNEDG